MPGSIFKVKYGLEVDGSIDLSGQVDGVSLSEFKIAYDNHNHNTTYALIAQATGSVTQHDDVSNAGSGVIISTAERSKLGGIETSADVTDTDNVTSAGAVMKSWYNANSILIATTDNTPIVLSISSSTLIGRASTGAIASLSAGDVRTILNIENGADATDYTNVSAAGAVMKDLFDANTFLYATSDNTPEAKTSTQVRALLNVADNANYYVHPDHTGEVTSTADGATVVVDNVIDANNLKGNAGALGDGTNGYALVAGSTANAFAWYALGSAAAYTVATSLDTSSDLPTSNIVKSYIDNALSGLGNVIEPVADLAALKALVSGTNMDDKDMLLVESLGLYRFDNESVATGNDNTIITPTTGSGRWYKMSSTINEHANLDNIDKWNGTGANTYHVPNINGDNSYFLNGAGAWAVPPGTYVHPDHSGDVTSVSDGATTIVLGAVTNAKLEDMPQNTIKGRISAGTGDPENLTATQVRSLINVASGANNYTHPTQTAISIDTSGAQVLDVLTVNTLGHVTNVTLRNLTLGDLSYTGAFNANFYEHPSHTGDVTGSGALTIANGKIKEQHLQAISNTTLSGGSDGSVLQWDTGGTFKWGTAADPTQVAYTYGDSSSFKSEGVGTSLVVIDSFTKTSSRSAEWLISISDVINSRYETLKMYAVHDGTNVYYNEFGNVHTTLSPGITFSVIINGANVELKASGTSVDNDIIGIRNLIDV